VGSYELTDNEGTLLGLVVRAEPITAYQIAQVYEQSPVSNFNTSKGKIYPMIRRLKERGLIEARAVKGDARGTELLTATAAGREATRAWSLEIRPTHLLLEDPMRTKIQSFDLLTREERIEWCALAKALLADRLRQVENYRSTVEVPFQEFVHDGAVSAIKDRIAWIDRVLANLVLRGRDSIAPPKAWARKK